MTANRFHSNAAAADFAYPGAVRSALSLTGTDRARTEISTWPGYAPTPLHDLDRLAGELGIGRIWYKDESSRLGLGSFKALGGAYAIFRELQRRHRNAGGPELRDGPLAEIISNYTFVCATDGNHGRSVAWGARIFGGKSKIFLPSVTSPGREAAIEALGAEVIRVDGSYDDAVRAVDLEANQNDWIVISDTSYPGYEEIPIDIMHGYGVSPAEALDQLSEGPRPLPTHVFVQAGVGGFAAAVCAYFWERLGPKRPVFIVVEPVNAACCLATAERGLPTTVHDVHRTIMACLAAGDISIVAWEVLKQGANGFLAVPDHRAEEAMRRLDDQSESVVAGESGAAGLAGLLAAVDDPGLRKTIALDASSRVLLFGTEGATDPAIYERIVGHPPT